MADEQEVEVKLDDAAAPVDVAEQKIEATEATKQGAPDDEAIAELKRQHDEILKREKERAQRAESAAVAATQQAQRAAAEAEQVKTQIVGTELQAALDKIAAAKSAADAAERQYAAAMESGNWQEAAKAQRQLAKAEADGVALERDKSYLESRQHVTEGRVEPQRGPQEQADPIEATLARCTPRTRDWLREHMDVLTDRKTQLKAQLADEEAKAKGLRADTDEYFRFAEEYIYGQPVDVSTQSQQQNGQTRQRTMPAAPPSRDAGSSPAASSTKIKLTSGEVERATDGTIVWNTGPNKGKPIGVQEMARRKALLEREGAYIRRVS